MRWWRQTVAFLLMAVGISILVRGVEHSLRGNLGWPSLVISVVLGTLTFALGVARWRFWQQG